MKYGPSYHKKFALLWIIGPHTMFHSCHVCCTRCVAPVREGNTTSHQKQRQLHPPKKISIDEGPTPKQFSSKNAPIYPLICEAVQDFLISFTVIRGRSVEINNLQVSQAKGSMFFVPNMFQVNRSLGRAPNGVPCTYT